MKHRDRGLVALNHEEPDRCPMQISFTPEFASRLKEDSGLSDEDLHNPHGVAIRTQMVRRPLANDQAIDSYEPPDPNRPELYVEAERVIKEFQNEYWIAGVTVTTVFETAWVLRAYEKTLMDFVLNPGLVERLCHIPFNYHLTAAKKFVEMDVDMIWRGCSRSIRNWPAGDGGDDGGFVESARSDRRAASGCGVWGLHRFANSRYAVFCCRPMDSRLGMESTSGVLARPMVVTPGSEQIFQESRKNATFVWRTTEGP